MTASPNPPAAPYFKPIDIPRSLADALNYDVQGFDFSDQTFAAQYPGLVATRNAEIQDSYNQLTGPLDPTVENSFTAQGLSAGLSSTGGGDPLAGLNLTDGSAGKDAASVSFANNVLQKQDYDRQNFDQLLAQNPQRAFGFGGSDIASILALNSGGVNTANQQNYSSQLAGIYGQGQQGANTGAQIAAFANILASLNSRNTSG